MRSQILFLVSLLLAVSSLSGCMAIGRLGLGRAALLRVGGRAVVTSRLAMARTVTAESFFARNAGSARLAAFSELGPMRIATVARGARLGGVLEELTVAQPRLRMRMPDPQSMKALQLDSGVVDIRLNSSGEVVGRIRSNSIYQVEAHGVEGDQIGVIRRRGTGLPAEHFELLRVRKQWFEIWVEERALSDSQMAAIGAAFSILASSDDQIDDEAISRNGEQHLDDALRTARSVADQLKKQRKR